MRLYRLSQSLRESMWLYPLSTVHDRARLQQLTYCAIAPMPRQHHDRGVGSNLEDATGSAHPATLGHHDIDEGGIGLTGVGELDRLLTVSS